jgi:hypothetical protein
MRLAFGQLGIRPTDFWAMSMVEWTMLVQGRAGEGLDGDVEPPMTLARVLELEKQVYG